MRLTFLPFRMIIASFFLIFEVSAHQHTLVMSGHPGQCRIWLAIYCVFWSKLALQKQLQLGTPSLAEYLMFG